MQPLAAFRKQKTVDNSEEFARRIRETEGAEIAHIVCAHQHETRDGFGYLPFDECFTGGLTCQCVCSFENKTPFDGIAQPAILRFEGAETPTPVRIGAVDAQIEERDLNS